MPQTIKDILSGAQSRLRCVSDAPDIDAERLLLHVLGLSESAWLFAHGDEVLSRDKVVQFDDLVHERCSGKPLAYIIGYQEFYGRNFFVNTDVLIPRPSTEHLIDAAKHIIRDRDLVAADVGTGSGCIAITLLLECPSIKMVYATDISRSALTVAQRNAREYGVYEKIEFLHGDMFVPLEHKSIDLIVSNPPYVPRNELDAVSTKETAGLQFEPRSALDGGVDGQRFVQEIASCHIPSVVECTGGDIQVFQWKERGSERPLPKTRRV